MATPEAPSQAPSQASGEGDCPPAIYAETFKLFSKFGDTKSDGKHITLSQSDKWMKQAKVIDGKTITSTDTGIYFKKLKQQKVTFTDYNKFLDDLAKAKKVEVEEIKRKLSNCGPPGLSTNVIDYQDNLEDSHVLSQALQCPESKTNINQSSHVRLPEEEQIFGDYVASEMRQIKTPANKRKLRNLINEAIMRISDLDANELESYHYSQGSSTPTSPGSVDKYTNDQYTNDKYTSNKYISNKIYTSHKQKSDAGAKTPSAVERLTDPSKYTGSHKQRFDETGKGKGIAGRKDLVDKSGYVSGYQNKNTYSKDHPTN